MGGKSGGGSFAEKGTPLSAQFITQRDARAAQAAKEKRLTIPPGGGEAGPGYEGGKVSEETGKAALAGLGAFMGTMAVTGEPITSATMAYQAYKSMEPEDKAKVDKEAKARGFSLSSLFGSLLGDDEGDGWSDGGNFGSIGAGDLSGEAPGSAGGSMGRGGSEGSYA